MLFILTNNAAGAINSNLVVARYFDLLPCSENMLVVQKVFLIKSHIDKVMLIYS